MLPPADAIARLRALPGGDAVLDAARRTPGSWVVGGAVRDALLGRIPRELDLLVEGDPAALLQALGGTVVAHSRFGTATVTLDGVTAADGEPITVDVARARAEHYARPGALPDVTATTVPDDLRRRDVSINAIALRPVPHGAPEVLAVPGALEDLQSRVLRVLHARSFTDDPTRLWRVARYAARLSFRVDDATVALAQQADPRTVSGPRLGNELRLALREADPLAALTMAGMLNRRLLVPGLDPAPRRLTAALDLLPPGGRRDLVTLASCCAAVDAAALVAWLEHLGLRGDERDIVAAGSRASTAMPLHAAVTPAQIARAARGVPVEIVALAGGPQAERWIRELRHVRLQITGDDLVAAGVPEGPLVGRLLQGVLDRRLDGTLAPGRESELAAALAELAL